MLSLRVRRVFVSSVSAVVWTHFFLFASVFAANTATNHWFKGNLHTHSFWSDGDDFPEMGKGVDTASAAEEMTPFGI